jgi:glycosyltransferase involved in cell wall biosynthesis
MLDRLAPAPPGKSGWPWTEESPQLPETMPGGSPWPRVSIVTPSFNQAQFLEETIRSVLLQGYPNLEYIIMDGGSTDGSPEIIEKYARYLAHLESGPDAGQSAAIAKGFAQATGEVLAWLNSDDRYLPGTLARTALFMSRHKKVVFGNGDVNLVDANGRFLKRLYAVRPNFLITANLGIHRWPQQGCFWRRSAYERVGGMDTTLRFCMDRDLFLRLAALGPAGRIPGSPLAEFRTRETAKSSTMTDVAQTESKLLISRYSSLTWRNRRRQSTQANSIARYKPTISWNTTGMSWILGSWRCGHRK